MITIRYSAVDLEWILQYKLDDICTQTVRTSDPWYLQKQLDQFLTLEKGVAHGRKFYTVPQ